MISTPQLSNGAQLATASSDASSSLPDVEPVPYIATCNIDDASSPISNDYVSDDNMLPIIKEGVHFGDNMRCATVNSRGSGEHFAKVDIVVDFAVDESLDIVVVTELKTTMARTKSSSIRNHGFYSWWGARDVKQSYSDGILILVCNEWAKYVQKIEYWGGRLVWVDFAFPGGLQLCYIGVYAPSVASELHPLVARLQGILSSACASGLQVIIAGDLNGVFDPSQDRIPGHTVINS